MKVRLGFAAASLLGLGLLMMGAGSADAQNDPQKVKKAAKVGQPQVSRQAQSQRQGERRGSNTGRNIAAGVAAGVVGAIILNEAARASDDGDRGYSCEALERRCDNGQDWACRKLDRNSC